ncbi:pleckstrin homology domain-containing family A member 7-like [Sinocyclocheilus grahami]|uniref:pleckstrin homology domain-containing family A member 7-like n=1 Tax=Sinocyclocheilus grahami TaxID=75366 RepID=UPI0007AC7CDA|nr:PREDICTED: pleckstrin homology domain-containing family A member 7-like [Sinocyclocheilus grahami]
MAAPFGRDTLPEHWSYGVCRDGRVFFINDKTRGTTWLHPRTGEPVNSGHMIRSDLPRGWEEGFTEEGASYFINHNLRTTTFRHPVTGHISSENTDFILQDQANLRMSKPPPEPRPPSMVSESSVTVSSSPADTTSGSRSLKPSGKVHCFGKRDHSIKRNPNVPVVVRGWLYKQDSSGMRLWKRKWFVLSDYCLFYYKDSREETVLGSIPLPSYVISPVGPEDHISRKYAFKACHTGMRSYIYNKNSLIGSQAEHCGMRTYFFSADTQEDMNGWIRAMNQAALMQSHGMKREAERSFKSEQQAVPQTNHFCSSIKSSSQAEALQQTAHVEVVELRPERDGEDCYVYSKELMEDPVKISSGELEMEGISQSGAHSRPPSTVPTHRNGLPPSGIPPDQNGNVVYKRGLVPRTDTEKKVQRKTALAQVEHWVKVQKGDPKSHPTVEYTLPRRTPPLQPKSVMMETYQSLPKSTRHHSGGSSPPVPRNLPSDYKYAHDRLSHFRMSTDERMATKEGMVWQLYEWQQRQQFRHGSPTAPIYTGPDYMDTSAFRVTLEMPRSISVPPSPCDIPPPGHPSKFFSPRRPHTPADRVTVRPLDDFATVDTPSLGSPRGICSQISKTSQIERRSMPTMGYITHTVSAPSLHGKTPEELTLLLIQLRRHRAKMASVRSDTFTHLQNQHNGLSGPSLQADDTYIQLKKDLEYLDLKVTGRDSLKDRPPRPVKIAESDIDVKLSRLCEQDKILQELEARIRTLKEDKDKLESVLDVSHQQMELYQDQPAHAEKIAYQQKLLREDVVHIRADISQVSTLPDPERKLVPSASLSAVPSLSASPSMGELKAAQPSPHLSLVQSTQQPLQLSHTAIKPKWPEEDAPPRPPLPHLYSPDEPFEMENAWAEYSQLERDVDRLRSALQDQMTHSALSQAAQWESLTGSSSRLNQSSNISSFVTLRRGLTTTSLKERPKSALERLYSGEPVQQRGRMSAEEQLERMKRHQKALVRERKRTLSQGERQASSSRASSTSKSVSADLGSWRREQDFDLQLLEQAVQGEERPVEHKERQRSRSDEWLTLSSTPMRELDLEPLDYQLDLSKELAKPQKVAIPERYVDMDPEEPLSPQEMEARHRKVERIKSILAKSSVQNIPPPAAVDKPVLPDIDSALQEQERIITMSYALASEASLKSKQVAASPPVNSPTSLPQPPPPPPLPPPAPVAVSTAQSAPPPLSNGFHYTFV